MAVCIPSLTDIYRAPPLQHLNALFSDWIYPHIYPSHAGSCSGIQGRK